MPLQLEQLFELMNKNRKKVFADITLKDNEKNNNFYSVLLNKLGKTDDVEEIKKYINEGQFEKEQREICDVLYQKIFNRLEEQPASTDFCKGCLVEIDPYDENRNLSCNECNILNLLPFYQRRFSSSKVDETMESNALFIYNAIKNEFKNYKQSPFHLNKYTETMKIIKSLLTEWENKVSLIIEKVEKQEYKNGDNKQPELTEYEKILRLTTTNKDVDKDHYFKKSDFKSVNNPHSLNKFIKEKVSELDEVSVNDYISELEKEKVVKRRIYFPLSNNQSNSYLNVLIDELLNKQRKGLKDVDEEVPLPGFDQETYNDKSTKSFIRTKRINKRNRDVKLIAELLKQIDNDRKKKWIQKGHNIIVNFLKHCEQILNRDLQNLKRNDEFQYDMRINLLIDENIKKINSSELLNVLYDYEDIIKKTYSDSDSDYIYKNKNFPYDKDGILMDFEKGSNDFKYLNKLLNLLACNIKTKKILENMENKQNAFDKLKGIEDSEFMRELDSIINSPSLIQPRSSSYSDEEFMKEIDSIINPPLTVESTNDEDDVIKDDFSNFISPVQSRNEVLNSQGQVFINTKTNPQTIANSFKKGASRFFSGVKNVVSKFTSGETTSDNVKYPMLPFDGRKRSPKKNRKVSKSLKKNRKVSKSPKKNRKVSKSLKNRKVSKSPKKNRKVSKSPKKNRKVSKSVKKNRKVSKSVKKNSKW